MAACWLAVGEVALRLGVSSITVRRWIAAGVLPAAKPRGQAHGRWFIAEADVLAILTPAPGPRPRARARE